MVIITLNKFSCGAFQENFRKRASAKLKKAKDSAEDEAKAAQRVRKRHSGVIGLCSFVDAFPYDVPEFVPDVLMHLSGHLHDPQPIPVSHDE